MPSLPCRNKTLAIAVKKYAKEDIKVFYSCAILPNFQLSSISLLLIFFQSSIFLTFSISSKLFPNLPSCVKVPNLKDFCMSLIWFSSKFEIRNVSTLFLSTLSAFSGNLIHNWKCRKLKKKSSGNICHNV